MATKKTAAARPTPAKRTRRKKLVPTAEQIAERAYYLYLERGGDQVENWLAAERELAA